MYLRRPQLLLPNKYIHERQSVIGQSGLLLLHKREDQTVSELWHAASHADNDLTFGRFEMALTLLYTLGAVTLVHGILTWGD
jgi:hypothetical protein